MKRDLGTALTFGLCVFLALSALFAAIHPNVPVPAHCADGWKSKSIGKYGACSHHGGVRSYGGQVDTTPGYLFLISALAGAAIFLGMSRPWTWERRKRAKIDVQPERLQDILHSGERIVLSAIRDRKKITFTYTKRKIRGNEQRCISPITVKFLLPNRDETKCVIGYCHQAHDTRTFTLARMTNIRISD